MSILADSRYAEGKRPFKAHDSRDNTYQATILRTFPYQTGRYYYYVWLDNDRIDTVAYKLLGSEEFWWQIMDFNPEIIDPYNIPPNTLVRIPNV
jgi:hypothetical protein